jgi:hypothetical protein
MRIGLHYVFDLAAADLLHLARSAEANDAQPEKFSL